MRVFVTGATGFIGTAITRELLANGHQVLGMARSDAGAAALAAAGAEVHHGSLEDLDSLRSGAAAADGVIHAAFIHDFSNYAGAAVVDQRAIEAIGAELAGSDRPFVVTAGTAGLAPGQVVTEETSAGRVGRVSEITALALAEQGVRVSVMRLPPSVHDRGDHGFIPTLINVAREKGVSAYPGDGANRWAAVHRLDAARLFRLALESAQAGTRLHGVGDEGVATREIAEVIGRHLNIPVVSLPTEKLDAHFGWIGRFFALDMAASSQITQERFGWHPEGVGLLEDLEQGDYFAEK